MRIFVSGGCKNGKSTFAQRVAKGQGEPLYYVATMSAVDSEDEERIVRHRAEREGWGFTTVEQARGIEGILDKCECGGSFLLDSLTALLANEMFSAAGDFDGGACGRVADGLEEVLRCLRNIVVVSDYIYSDAFVYDGLTEEYRKSLAVLDRLAARYCDVVLEVSYTQVVVHKGGGLFDAVY